MGKWWTLFWRSFAAVLVAWGLAACDSTDDGFGDGLTEITLLVAYTPAVADTVDDIRQTVDAAIAIVLRQST